MKAGSKSRNACGMSSFVGSLMIYFILNASRAEATVTCHRCNTGLEETLGSFVQHQGYKLKTYDNNRQCADPFHEHSSIGTCEGDMCVKTTIDDGAGKLGVIRNCDFFPKNVTAGPEHEECGVVTGARFLNYNLQIVGSEMRSCKCTSQLCNQGNQNAHGAFFVTTLLIFYWMSA